MAARSVFVLSLPRSMSSVVHRACGQALSLRAPSWVSDGEIMNVDRFALADRRHAEQGVKYTQPTSAELRDRLFDWLDTSVQPFGLCYKDVVQPFVASAWLRHRLAMEPDLCPKVLRIEADVAFVACRMIELNWLYPAAVAPRHLPTSHRMVYGLTMAQRALRAVGGEAVAFEDLLRGPSALSAALRRLHPDPDVPLRDVARDRFDATLNGGSYARICRSASYREAKSFSDKII